MKVLVVGAGPTGLTAGVELARRGVAVTVIDKRDAASSFSRAVGITPRSLETLAPSGVSEALLAEGVRFRGARFYKGADLVFELPLKVNQVRHGHDFILGLAQDRTETHLAEACRRLGGEIHYGRKLAALQEEGETVIAETADGMTASYDYVIGADGIHSTVRNILGIEFPGFDLPETWSIADVDAADWPNPEHFTICLLPEGGAVVVVPLERERYRVIANRPDALQALPLEMAQRDVRREGQFTISIRQVKQYTTGRVFLAGDAAHCHSPAGGRGMNLGIADAADLARRLTEGGLEGYSDARYDEGKRTIAFSERARKQVTATSPVTRAAMFGVMRLTSWLPPLQRRAAETLLYE